MANCSMCFDGKILDERHSDYEKLDRELTRLIDGGEFSYYAAFKRATRLYPAIMDCPDCNGTDKAE